MATDARAKPGRRASRKPRPTWEVAYFFPAQGQWTEDDYFELEESVELGQLLELSRGRLEVRSMPTQSHQCILIYLFELLKAFVTARALGNVQLCGMHVKLGKRSFRAPDVLYMKKEHASRRLEKYWEGADLVMEIISPDPKDRNRDLVDKVRDYARAGIPEYWIVDPQEELIRVLVLDGNSYKVHGEFRKGTKAMSVLLPGFEVTVDTALSPPQ
jgi:Uma2 family endonuclease